MNILDSTLFKRVMFLKFFMVLCIWGLIPLTIPVSLVPLLGFSLNDQQIIYLRMWGIIVLLGFFIYLYIYRKPHSPLSKHLLLFSILDNGGIGLLLLIFTPLFSLPWGIWINIPFQLFFGYWFYRFYKEGYTNT